MNLRSVPRFRPFATLLCFIFLFHLSTHAQGIFIDIMEPNFLGKNHFQVLAPNVIDGPFQARFSPLIEVTNGTGGVVNIEKIEVNGYRVSDWPSSPFIQNGDSWLFRPGNYSKKWGTLTIPWARPYVLDLDPSTGDPNHLWNGDFPTQCTVSVYIEDDPTPTSKIFDVKWHVNDADPNPTPLTFPGHESDLRLNEFWTASSNHPGDLQVFALDMGVRGWDGSDFTEIYAGADDNKRESYRIYGQPVYAMSDGDVEFLINDHEEWIDNAAAKAHETHTDHSSDPMSEYYGGLFMEAKKYNTGGNEIFIRNVTEVWVYAHLQPGSIPPHLLLPNASVKKGQYLGKVGLSGNVSHPHIHVHVKKLKPGGTFDGSLKNAADLGEPVPMSFQGIHTITVSEAEQLAANDQLKSGDWQFIGNGSAPHDAGLMYPDIWAPKFVSNAKDDATYAGIWQTDDQIELRQKSQTWNQFKSNYDRLTADKFRLTDIETVYENGDQVFIGLYKYDDTEPAHELYHALDWNDLKNRVELENRFGTRRIVDMVSFEENGARRFAGVFAAGTYQQEMVAETKIQDFLNAYNMHTANGFRLVDLEVYNVAGTEHFEGIFSEGAQGHAMLQATGWGNFQSLCTTQFAAGLTLIDIESADRNGVREYYGVFRSGSPAPVLERHTGFDQFMMAAERFRSQGYRLVDWHIER